MYKHRHARLALQLRWQQHVKWPSTVICRVTFVFQPIAVETQGPLNESARDLLSDVGRKISERSGDEHAIQFLFQRISVVVQRFNGVLLHDSFCVEDQSD